MYERAVLTSRRKYHPQGMGNIHFSGECGHAERKEKKKRKEEGTERRQKQLMEVKRWKPRGT